MGPEPIIENEKPGARISRIGRDEGEADFFVFQVGGVRYVGSGEVPSRRASEVNRFARGESEGGW